MRYGRNDFARGSSAVDLFVEPQQRLESDLLPPPTEEESSGPRFELTRGLQRDNLLRQFGRPLCVFVPVFVVLVPRGGSVPEFLLALVVAFVWLIAITLANSSAWFSPLALGTRVTSALGVAAGVPVIILVEDLFPGNEISSVELALSTAGVAASAILLWEVATGEPKVRRVLIVGAGGGGHELARQLGSISSSSFVCLGLVEDESSENGDSIEDETDAPAVLGPLSEMTEILRRHQPHLVVFAGNRRDDTMSKLLDACPADFKVLSLPDFYEHAFGFVPIDHLSPMWFMSVLHLYRRPYPRTVKKAFDLIVATTILVVCLPLLLAIALLVRASGPGPIIYRQQRVGEAGQPFEILKFRTMIQDAEQPGLAIWATPNDTRVTRIGRQLRRTRLDELPQLWNVLRGEMSVVGPRPERPEFISSLEQVVPHWTRRNLVKPGITGWAQVRVGYTSDSVSAIDKLSYDLYYLKHQSLLLDLAIAAKTGAILFSGSGSR